MNLKAISKQGENQSLEEQLQGGTHSVDFNGIDVPLFVLSQLGPDASNLPTVLL